VPGTPTVTVDWRPPQATRAAPPPAPRAAARAAAIGPRAASLGTTLENTSPTLRARLAALAARGDAAAYLEVAAAYRAHGVDDRGFDYLLEGLTHYPTHPALHEAAARQWRDWGLLDRALRHAHLAVHYGPRSAAAHTTLGTVLWGVGARDDAAAAFARAAELAPHAAYAQHNRCVAERALGRSLSTPCPPPRGTAAEVPGRP
jgi:Flp pilus assembly protein TadD